MTSLITLVHLSALITAAILLLACVVGFMRTQAERRSESSPTREPARRRTITRPALEHSGVHV